jgi:hypothetical protein
MILHCDMDAFYASVEERDRPESVVDTRRIGTEKVAFLLHAAGRFSTEYKDLPKTTCVTVAT